LKRLSSLDEVKRYYEAREMAIHEKLTRIAGASAEGLVEGRAECEAEDIVKGKMETAQNLLSMGMSVQESSS